MDSWITSVIESMGYVGVAFLMALENVFPPIPSEVIMPLAGYTAAQSGMNLWLAIAVGVVGTLVGTLPYYVVARWIGEDRLRRWVSRHGHWLTLDEHELDRASKWFDRRGRLFVLFGRLVPGIHTFVSIPAGFHCMPFWSFLAYTAIGTAVWTAGLAIAGNALGESYARVGQYLGPVTYGVLGVLFIVYVYRLIKMRRSGGRGDTARAGAAGG